VAEELENRLLLSVNVLQYRYDAASSGVNSNEVQLTPANVKTGSFGKLFSVSLDGLVYAEPLVDTGVTITAGVNTTAGATGVHNVVYVVTENDSVYAINADAGANGQVLWKRAFLGNTTNTGGDTNNTLGATVIHAVTNGDVSNSDITPTIGITSTPVIDPATGIMYVVAKTKETVGGVATFVTRLHAISIANGTDLGTPFMLGYTTLNGTGGDVNTTPIYAYGTGKAAITDPYNGTGRQVVQFDSLRGNQRTALSLVNGNIYIAWASHGDVGPYHGWLATVNVTNVKTSGMTLSGVLCTSPNDDQAGIWAAGGAVVFEPDDSAFYFMTGNGTGGAPTLGSNGLPTDANYNEAVIKAVMDPSTSATNQGPNGWGMKVVDFFIPYNVAQMDAADSDFGSGAPALLPASAGIPGHPNLLIAAGKDGRVYVLDRNNLGHYNSSGDPNALNSVVNSSGQLTPPDIIGGTLSTPTYFNGKVYLTGGYGDHGKAFTISSTGKLVAASQTALATLGIEPGNAIISANGTTNGIAWYLDRNSNELHAYDANSLATELWNSNEATGNSVGTVIRFSEPTVANGEVFVGTANGFVAYGLVQPPSQVPMAPTLLATALSGSSINLTWSDPSVSPNQASVYLIEESTDGSNFTQIATAPQNTTSIAIGALTPNTKYYFRIRGSNTIGNSPYSNVANATTTNLASGIDFSGGFASSGSQLSDNGSSTISGSGLELTDGGANEAASSFFKTPIDVTTFSTQFTFQLSSGSSTADGFTFTLQDAGPTAVGSAGGGLGFGGINTSIGIKFDLFNNNGEGVDSTGLYTNGASPTSTGSIDLTSSGIDLHSGDTFQVNLNYDGTTLTETLKDTNTSTSVTEQYPVNIPNIVGSNSAYAGFTGGTNTVSAVQKILTWTFTPSAATSPQAPIGLGATPATDTSVSLTWTNPATNQTGYHLDRATDAGFTQNLITETLPGSPASFTDTTLGLAPGSTFYYRLRSFNAAGDSGNSNVASVTIPLAPPKATAQTIVTVSATSIDITWTDNAGHSASGYDILRAANMGIFSVVASLPPTSRPAPSGYGYTDTNLTPGTFYEYHIEAVNTSGHNDFAGVNATTLPDAPTGVIAAPGNNVVALAWDATTAAVSYNIYRGTTPGGESPTPIATGITTTSFQDSTATNGVPYYYEITAVNNNIAPLADEGAKSSEVTATPGVQSAPTVTPSAGAFGAHVDISVTGNGTHFAAGVTTASVGAGVTVDSVTVTDATHAVVHVDIDPNATAGFRNLILATGGETVASINGFLVTATPDMPVLIAPPSPSLFLGLPTSFNLGFFGGGAGPWNVDVNWGDGSPVTTFAATTAGAITPQNHTYTAAGVDTLTVTVTNTAATTQNVGSATATISLFNDTALILTHSTGSGALSVTGLGSLTATGAGQVYVNSKHKTAVIATPRAKVSAGLFYIAGGVRKGSPLTGTVNTGTPPLANPLASLPNPSLPHTTFKAVVDNKPTPLTLQPGTYIGGIHAAGKASITLQPGLYYLLGGGFIIAGHAHVVGTGVTIYNSGGRITIAGSVNLTPANTGTYAGVVFFQPASQITPITITGNLTMEGIFDAPGALMNLAGRGRFSDNDDADDVIDALAIFSSVRIGASAAMTIDSASNTPAGLLA
jgi:hypothetical protein